MKYIICFIFLCLICGCAASGAEKDAWVSEMYRVPAGEIALEKYPEFAYCFDESPDKASDDLTMIWRDAILANEKNYEPLITKSLGVKYGEELGNIIEKKYISQRIDRYLTGNLSEKQLGRCREVLDKIVLASMKK